MDGEKSVDQFRAAVFAEDVVAFARCVDVLQDLDRSGGDVTGLALLACIDQLRALAAWHPDELRRCAEDDPEAARLLQDLGRDFERLAGQIETGRGEGQV
jgi:hypothetical protein